jgi:hypothetical protein
MIRGSSIIMPLKTCAQKATGKYTQARDGKGTARLKMHKPRLRCKRRQLGLASGTWELPNHDKMTKCPIGGVLSGTLDGAGRSCHKITGSPSGGYLALS